MAHRSNSSLITQPTRVRALTGRRLIRKHWFGVLACSHGRSTTSTRGTSGVERGRAPGLSTIGWRRDPSRSSPITKQGIPSPSSGARASIHSPTPCSFDAASMKRLSFTAGASASRSAICSLFPAAQSPPSALLCGLGRAPMRALLEWMPFATQHARGERNTS